MSPFARPRTILSPPVHVILSAAKDLDSNLALQEQSQILRCAQDDMYGWAQDDMSGGGLRMTCPGGVRMACPGGVRVTRVGACAGGLKMTAPGIDSIGGAMGILIYYGWAISRQPSALSKKVSLFCR